MDMPLRKRTLRRPRNLRSKLTMSAARMITDRLTRMKSEPSMSNSADPTLHFSTWGAEDFFNAKIPSYHYLDLARAGANNALDKDPPIFDTSIVSGGDSRSLWWVRNLATDHWARPRVVARPNPPSM